MRGVVLVLSLSILAVPTAVGAHGGDPNMIHACVHQDRRDGEVHGRVRIVLPNQQCRRNEAPVHWSVMGPAGPAGPQAPAGPPGSLGPAGGGLTVRDTVGTMVGSVTGLSYDGSQRVLPNVVLQRNGLLVALLVHLDHFEGTGASLVFESPGCPLGSPLLDGDFTTLILPATIEGPGSTVYVPDTSVAPLSGSMRGQSLLQAGQCFTFPFDLVSAFPALPLVNLDTLFTPPFSIQ